jgi:hypothetical protein
MKPTPFCLVVALLLCAAPGRGAGADEATLRFTRPDKPGTIRIELAAGNLRLRGLETDTLTVRPGKAISPDRRADGFHALGPTAGFSLTERGNVARLESFAELAGGKRDATAFDVTVPRATTVIVANGPGSSGTVVIADVDGDVEANIHDGNITLDRIGGAAAARTAHGSIEAIVLASGAGEPLTFVSEDGPIYVSVPAATKAKFRLDVRGGEILTDFDPEVLAASSEELARSARSLVLPGPVRGLEGGVYNTDLRDQMQETMRQKLAAQEYEIEAYRVEVARQELAEQGIRLIPPMPNGKPVTGTLNRGGKNTIAVTTLKGDVILRQIDTP